jgi:glycerol uptake facilitator-like aquaporin
VADSPPRGDVEPAPGAESGPRGIALPRKLLAELLGTAFLVIAVVGSGIMASRASPEDAGLQLLENAAATAGALVALILAFGGVSGAHFNPAVTVLDRCFGTIGSREAALYVAAQTVGAFAGVVIANLMFELDAVELSQRQRSSGALWLSEVIATTGLLVVIHGCARSGRSAAVPYAVGLWIAGAYWFTSSTSFANPVVTLARSLSDSFAGIAPASVPMFVVMQLAGALVAYGIIRGLAGHEIVVPAALDNEAAV